MCIAGSYCEHHHGQLFDCLRGLAVQWYWKRTLRSFLNYLREQNGRGKTSEEVVEIKGRPWKFEFSSWVRQRYGFRLLAKAQSRKLDRSSTEFQKNLTVGAEAIWRATQASWWNWEAGLTICFWRWPSCYHLAVRDSTKAFIHRNRLPSYLKPQQLSKNSETQERVKKKLA